MLMIEYKDIGWWYWAMSAICLLSALAGVNNGYEWALFIGAIQLILIITMERSLTSFPIQIRVGYLSVLLLALSDGFDWILWIPAFGILLRVLTGYCINADTIKTNFRERNRNILHGLHAFK